MTFANQTKSHEMLTHCSWYIEARNEHETLLLKTSRVESKKSTLPAIDTNAEVTEL